METDLNYFTVLWMFGGSDPTYEAWKHLYYNFTSGTTLVPILPTRHGNLFQSPCFLSQSRCSDPTYEAWKLESFL